MELKRSLHWRGGGGDRIQTERGGGRLL